MSVKVPLLTFNDVYRVSQRYVPQPGAPDDPSSSKGSSISVSQFGELLLSRRETWADSPPLSNTSRQGDWKGKGKGKGKEGLVLFAGDVFNPSVESSVTRGSHMVPIMNALEVDCAVVGNHDFDFGLPHLTKLLNATTFPWLLSNIIDTTTGNQPEPLKRYWVTERCGVRIGVIGLVEQDWIATIPSWPSAFEYRPMKETALQLSKELRDPQGEHRVEVIIALTHCRVPNDIRLANELRAVADKQGVEGEHGVDLLIGGHDHIYYIGKGAKSWEGYVGERDSHGTDEDHGVRLIKSGTDFRDLSSATLTLSPPTGSVRRRLIADLSGNHHYVLPSSPSSPSFDKLLSSLLSSVSSTLSKPVCFTLTPFDARSELVRTRETGLANWVADVLMHAYAESMMEGKQEGKDYVEKDGEDELEQSREGKGGADAVIICGGTLRGDSQYGPGKITLGDILGVEIMPFEDPVVCLEIDGKGIWDTIESALSKWPAQEGRFPIVAGLSVEWDHSKPPGKRVNSIRLVVPPRKEDDDRESPEDMVSFVEQEDGTRVEVKQRKMEFGDEVKNESGGRAYRVITREYMAEGYDGFEALKNQRFIVDDETGQIMSQIIRSFLLGSSYIFRHKQLVDAHTNHLSTRTDQVISRARAQHQSSQPSSLANSPRVPFSPLTNKDTASPVPEKSGSGTGKRHVVQHDWANIRDALHIAKNEHVSGVDVFEGEGMRGRQANGKPKDEGQGAFFVDKNSKAELEHLGDDLAIVSPLVDGRMRDVAEMPG